MQQHGRRTPAAHAAPCGNAAGASHRPSCAISLLVDWLRDRLAALPHADGRGLDTAAPRRPQAPPAGANRFACRLASASGTMGRQSQLQISMVFSSGSWKKICDTLTPPSHTLDSTHAMPAAARRAFTSARLSDCKHQKWEDELGVRGWVDKGAA